MDSGFHPGAKCHDTWRNLTLTEATSSMNWRNLALHPKPKVLRQFSAGWLVLFLGMGLHRWLALGDSGLGLLLLGLGILVGIGGLVRPGWVRWLFAAWMLLAWPLGWLISQASLAIMFYLVITPVALFFKLRRRDALGLQRDPGRASYWAPVQENHDIRRYFRQY